MQWVCYPSDLFLTKYVVDTILLPPQFTIRTDIRSFVILFVCITACGLLPLNPATADIQSFKFQVVFVTQMTMYCTRVQWSAFPPASWTVRDVQSRVNLVLKIRTK